MNPLVNKIFKRQNQKITWIIVGVVLVFVLVLLVVLRSSTHPSAPVTHHKKHTVDFESVSQISGYSADATSQAIGGLQSSSSEEGAQIKALQKQNTQLSADLKHQNKAYMKQIDLLSKEFKSFQAAKKAQQAKAAKAKKKAAAQKAGGLHLHQRSLMDLNQANSNMAALGSGGQTGAYTPFLGGISVYSAHYAQGGAGGAGGCTAKNCVIPGTFVKAVLLGAADASASVNGQSNTTPILFRVLGHGHLPNGFRSHLQNCRVLGEVYGDISSDRGEVKLVSISCMNKKGQSIVKNINGYATYNGVEGIRGTPVMRNGKILMNAGIAGALEGAGNTISQGGTTQSISGGSILSTVNPSQMGYGAVGGLLKEPSTMLGNYYVQLAEQYHPVIQLNAGTMVNLVFLSKFKLTVNQHQSKGVAPTNGQSGYWQGEQHQASSENPSGSGQEGNNLNQMNLGEAANPNRLAQIQQQVNDIDRTTGQEK